MQQLSNEALLAKANAIHEKYIAKYPSKYNNFQPYSYNEERYGKPVPVENRLEQIDRIVKCNSWFGVATVWNIAAIHQRIQRMLAYKQYTFASHHAGYNSADSLDVRTSQILQGSIHSNKVGDPAHVGLSDDSAHITVCDTYGVWGIHTSTQSYDHKGYRNPYLVFDYDRSGEQLKIVHLNGYDEILVWRISVEDPDALRDRLADERESSAYRVPVLGHA